MAKVPKYRNKRVQVGNESFDSKREAKRYGELVLLQRAGAIAELRRQVRITLIGSAGPILTDKGNPRTYVADFVYIDARNGLEVVEDAKGYPTPEYKLKRDILAAQGITIIEV